MSFDVFRSFFSSFGNVVVGPMLAGAATYFVVKLSSKLKDRKVIKMLNISTEKNMKIQELLTELRVKTEAARAYMSMFHNGDKFVDGSEILKKSRTNESVAFGVTYDAGYYQKIPISLIPEEMRLVHEEGPSFTLTKDLKDGKFKRMLLSRNIKAVARCAIKKNNDIIGFLGIDYLEEREPPKCIDQLCFYSGIIEQVLSAYNH